MSQTSFDYVVDSYSKEGKVTSSNPYRMVIDGQGKRLERPPGSGRWFTEDGRLLRDDSKAINEQKEAAALAAREAAEVAKKAANEKFVAEIRAEERAKLMEEMQKAKGK
jgi:hypothetical protein